MSEAQLSQLPTDVIAKLAITKVAVHALSRSIADYKRACVAMPFEFQSDKECGCNALSPITVQE
jgi:hypothetical protein